MESSEVLAARLLELMGGEREYYLCYALRNKITSAIKG